VSEKYQALLTAEKVKTLSEFATLYAYYLCCLSRDCSIVVQMMSLLTSDDFACPEAPRSLQFRFQEKPLYKQTHPETQSYHYGQVRI